MSHEPQRRRLVLGKGSAAAETERSTAPTREQAFDAFCTLLAFAMGQGTPAPDALLLLEDLPALYPVSRRVAADAARAGELAAVKVGRKLAARRSDVDAWIAGRKVTPRRPSDVKPDLDPAAAYAEMTGGR